MKKLLLLLSLLAGNFLFAQVGIGTDMPNPSSQLEIKSSNRGIMIPQVPLTSVTDQNTISGGNLESLLLYNTSTNATLSPGYYYWYQGSWNRLMTEADLPDNRVFWDLANNQFTYIDQNADRQVINPSDFQTLTFLRLNADGHTLEYVDENGAVTRIDFEAVIQNFETLTTIIANSDGTFTFTDEDGIKNTIDVSNLETLTSIALNPDNVNIDYTDESGTVTQLNLTQIVKNLETLTSVVANNDGTFTFTDEAGNTNKIDVGDLETLTSIVDNGNGTITYTDENNVETVINLATGPQGPMGPIGPQGPNGVVTPKDLTAGDASITVTGGTGAALVDSSIEVTDGGITSVKLASAAVTAVKINADVAGLGIVQNGATNALDVKANNGLNLDGVDDAVQLGGDLTKPTTINTDTTNTLALTGLESGSSNDNLVLIDKNTGIIKQSKSAMPKFFYMPSIVFDISTSGNFSVDLYSMYKDQFVTPMVSSSGATTPIPTLGSTELEYYVTYYDSIVFSNVSISANGVLSYTVSGAGATASSFMNIVFVVKD
ncbi:hypothetical protein LX77_01714 [Gelidibacter algens]|uniref:Collagen triple helix repeat protein n=1 Tax=Gelidibacter algens TaxID=49280 RepID=A0A1A7R1J6_9FLAO|nr:hypothetical protein [Gelidibacter algens]OBX25388.1 hypothetical protein A9996_10045 [Gelidibacter algens]RAJ24718.1 hypothetical protein LX77_01714 [Gelidibacter algens]